MNRWQCEMETLIRTRSILLLPRFSCSKSTVEATVEARCSSSCLSLNASLFRDAPALIAGTLIFGFASKCPTRFTMVARSHISPAAGAFRVADSTVPEWPSQRTRMHGTHGRHTHSTHARHVYAQHGTARDYVGLLQVREPERVPERTRGPYCS